MTFGRAGCWAGAAVVRATAMRSTPVTGWTRRDMGKVPSAQRLRVQESSPSGPSMPAGIHREGCGGTMVRKEQYRLGIVGLGRMASTIDDEVRGYSSVTLPYSVAAGARAIPRLRLAAGCDIRADKREAFSARWGVTELYEDYERMLREADLDLVAICTRGPLHAPMTLAAVAAGVPMVFCEKAMACSLAEADAVRAAIRAEGTRFNTGVLRRFDTRYHQARQLIREGAIGEPRAALHFAPSTLLHGHIHSMDTLSFLLDDPEILAVRGELLPRDLVAAAGRWEHDPRATYALEFAGGVEAISVAAGNWEF
ncbi:MAG: Gfo/Idh/MocA family oxidoreductase, partial [Armatimonadetes bacterium]|nr:Gfo/Idh/MocA family oxidoreductase [Armatimonadota bacterium]